MSVRHRRRQTQSSHRDAPRRPALALSAHVGPCGRPTLLQNNACTAAHTIMDASALRSTLLHQAGDAARGPRAARAGPYGGRKARVLGVVRAHPITGQQRASRLLCKCDEEGSSSVDMLGRQLSLINMIPQANCIPRMQPSHTCTSNDVGGKHASSKYHDVRLQHALALSTAARCCLHGNTHRCLP